MNPTDGRTTRFDNGKIITDVLITNGHLKSPLMIPNNSLLATIRTNIKTNTITIIQGNNSPVPVILIKPNGTLFWNGREVQTDDDFRAAMLDLVAALRTRY